jgi:uncharacterized protein YcfJ
VGRIEGTKDGTVVGTSVGVTLGAQVGKPVGATVGEDDSTLVGLAEGSREGTAVGTDEGENVSGLNTALQIKHDCTPVCSPTDINDTVSAPCTVSSFKHWSSCRSKVTRV